jgi:hypothetical protein
MKKLLLLSLLFVAFAANSVFAQVPRRVLVEEFTNTGCPPCALSDPWMNAFQSENIDKIAVLKFHTQGPDATDPYYNANKTDGNPRANYYSVSGVPTVTMDGANAFNPASAGQAGIQDVFDGTLSDSPTSPFEITIVQEKTADSIIATISVKAVGTVPSETDLRLACVFAEKYDKFTGSNGMPSYDYIVRKTLPGVSQTTGEITATAKYPNLSIAMGETKTFRYAAKIGSTWHSTQLITVAFIQGAASKTVYQSNWTVPSISATFSDIAAFNITPVAIQMGVAIKNSTSSPQTVSVGYSSPGTPAGWAFDYTGLTNGSVTLNPNEEKTIGMTLNTPATSIGSLNGDFTVTVGEGLIIGTAAATFFGGENTDIVVSDGIDPTASYNLMNSVNSNGLKSGVVSKSDFRSQFSDWSQFKTVYMAATNGVGFQIGTTEWENLDAHLAAGGNVLYTSTIALGVYYNSQNETYMDLWRNNFHIEPDPYRTGAANSWGTLTGVTSDAIGDALSATITPKVANRQSITNFDADLKNSFTNEKGDVVGARALSQAGKVAYLSFGLEQLAENDRNTVSKRIIDWFNGAASVKTSENAASVAISNYPNPAASTTTFTYSLTERSLVTLSVYDVMGREVANIVSNQMQDKGTYESDLDVSKLATGSYIYKMNVGGKMLSGTLNVVK